jgi:glucan phosphoethanolaminetransferase (alkaline phosphatase superfamily)
MDYLLVFSWVILLGFGLRKLTTYIATTTKENSILIATYAVLLIIFGILMIFGINPQELLMSAFHSRLGLFAIFVLVVFIANRIQYPQPAKDGETSQKEGTPEP